MSNVKHKLSIVFYVPGMKFNGDSLKLHSLGGSETAGLCAAREMAAIGHDVTMFCNTDKPGKYDEVNYLPIQNFQPYIINTSTDICIVQRAPQVFSIPMKSKINILWQHDLATKRNRSEFRGSLWNIDEVWGLSGFHVKQMSEVYKAPESLFWKTRNGIDKTRNYNLKRQSKRLIFTSRPERGMDILLFNIMPEIWKRDPEIELHLAGYDNCVPEMQAFYDGLHARIKEHQDKGYKIKHLGPLTKKQLYKEYQQATAYIYPMNPESEFDEISCITVMECFACGLPFVGTKRGALIETVNSNGLLIDDEKDRDKYIKAFVDDVLNLINSNNSQDEYRAAGYEANKNNSWSSIAKEWTDHFYGLFEKRTENKETLAKHLYRNEDIMALKHLIRNDSKLSESQFKHWKDKIEKEYAFIDDIDLYMKIYRQQGKDYVKNMSVYTKEQMATIYSNVDTRIRVVIDIMKTKSPTNILDYGCAIGKEAFRFANSLNCKITSINVSEDEINIFEKHREFYTNADKIKLVHSKTFNVPESIDNKFDTVFAGEILEHLPEPHKLIDQLESKCQEGGLMIFTVPTGPWGDRPDLIFDGRGHLWNFEKSDLKDLFGKKKQLSVKIVSANINPINKEPLGWYVISYIKDSKKLTGEVNLDRKISIQAPRQTISACMIVGGDQEGLLHRTLKSIRYLVDEIIIVDCGMNQICKDIIASDQYKDSIISISNNGDGSIKINHGKESKVKIIEGSNPIEKGFDVPRNESIKQASCDWILWIDTDEELLLPENAFKYLRHNYYNGYSIRQHHFSARPPQAFKCDMPIRLFRNRKDIKFFGFVHEHPEIELNKGIGESTIISDIEIAHDGYLTEEGRRIRFNRNIGLMRKDREKYPERVLGKFLWMRDEIHLARYTFEMTRGQVTPDIVKWCEDVIKTYQAEFLGKNQMMSHDGLEYYSEALRMLNRGLEYSFSLDIKPQGVNLNGNSTTARFASIEDFRKYVKAKTESMVESFQGKYL